MGDNYQKLMNKLAEAFLDIRDKAHDAKGIDIPEDLIKAIDDPSVDLDKLVVVQGLGGDWTPLSLAVKARRCDIIQRMLDKGASVNKLDSAKYSALLGAAMGGREEEARLLVTNGADPNVGASGQDDSMYYAAAGGWVGLTKLLILSGGRIEKAQRGVTYALQMLGTKDEGQVSSTISGMKHVKKANVLEIDQFLKGDAIKIAAKTGEKAAGGSAAASAKPAAASHSAEAKGSSGSASAQSTSPSAPAQQGQVMISYCWDQQSLAKLVQQELVKHGFKVWIDVEQMQGSILSAMAEALEESSVVLMCISEAYSKSANCRLEAEYCMKLRKPFIPLMMQSNFSPSGWLGISLGSKLYYLMHEPSIIPSKFKELLPVLQKHASPGPAGSIAAPAASPVGAAATTTTSLAAAAAVFQAAQMDAKALREHLKAKGCILSAVVEDFTGKDALELWRLSVQSPPLFKSLVDSLVEDVNIIKGKSVPVQILRLTAALRELFGNPS